MSDARREIAYVRVEEDGEESLLVAPVGAVLRDVLLANGISPYTAITERFNCGGRGLCATCGVRFAHDLDESGANGDIDHGSDDTGRDGERTAAGLSPRDNEVPDPEHWHDSLAARFGYPRLSCQIEVKGDMHVEIPEKIIWGSRRPEAERNE